MKEKHTCAGFRKTKGAWYGWPCGASAKYKYKGLWYCKNHLPIEASHKKWNTRTDNE